ncbi:MAG: response regulator [Chloroflexota bacterium]
MLKALVVEDEIPLQDLYSRVLENSGYAVAVADDGQQAIDLLQDHTPPNLMILDIRLPILGGYDVLQYLQAYPNKHLIHVVIVTATRDFEAYCDMLPSIEFLLKPVLPKHLLDVVTRHQSAS